MNRLYHHAKPHAALNRLPGIGAALATLLVATTATADGPQPTVSERTTESGRNWTGFYGGGYLGDAWGRSNWTARETGIAAPTLHGTLDFFKAYDAFKGTGSYFGGFQAGYNYMLPSGVVLGVEADVSAPNTIMGTQTFFSPSVGQASYAETVAYSGTVRGRLGYALGHWLVYGTGGFAWSYDQFTRTQLFGSPVGGTAVPGTLEKITPEWRTGWAAGAGVEVAITSQWTANLEYLLTAFGTQSANFPLAGQRFESDLTIESVRLGLNYQFGDAASNGSGLPSGPTAPKSDNWSVHGQTTFTQQYAFPFRAPYRGPNSLDSGAGRETWDATFYVGWRLWQGAEVWFNPEIDQGFGLSTTLGVAGFPSAEAYKVGANYPYTRLPRMFLRQTIGLSDETEKVEPGPNQFGGSQSKDRVVITVGKLSVPDVFDNNKYAHDPRIDFLNWAIVDTGTFDYAADAWAFTYGAAVEWYKGPWTLRAGLFDLSIVPNSTDLDPAFGQFQWLGEIERRYALWGQPGKLAVTGFLTRARMGRFSDAIRLANMTGEPADIAAVRQYRSRSGLSLNVEQQLSADIGVFARAGWVDGSVEPFDFTDVDRTVAAGMVINGRTWGRQDHTLGIAGLVNGISSEHVAFLNAGGLGILVGDGKLPHPRPEAILETYYSFPVLSWRATVDYQFIANPAYNADRGPVSILGTRLRAQF
jgi:high affinity Mn2+ porin